MLGIDARGREMLTYLPGAIVDVDAELLTDAQLADMAGWTRGCTTRSTGLDGAAGPWRCFHVPDATVVGHNDIAPYNLCFEGDPLVGVFDWDLAGPTTRLIELAHLAWSGVPLFRRAPAADVARRLELIAATYGGASPPRDARRRRPGQAARYRRHPRLDRGRRPGGRCPGRGRRAGTHRARPGGTGDARPAIEAELA